jgi:hypothetical protein
MSHALWVYGYHRSVILVCQVVSVQSQPSWLQAWSSQDGCALGSKRYDEFRMYPYL